MKLLIINGPNLNLLGLREPAIYGNQPYAHLCHLLEDQAQKLNISISIYQSNHEGAIVDHIQSAYQVYDGIIINPAAYTHTSIAILDALKAVAIPTIEVHLSEVNQREPYRQISYVGEYAFKTIMGKGFQGYLEAMEIFAQ